MLNNQYRRWTAAVLATFFGSIVSAVAAARDMPITCVVSALVAMVGACTVGYYILKFFIRLVVRIGVAAAREKDR